MKRIKGILAVVLTVLCILCLFAFTSSAAEEGKWIKTWGTAATEMSLNDFSGDLSGDIMKYLNFLPKDVRDELLKELNGLLGSEKLMNVAIRTVITPTASGEQLRVKFSNYYGKKPLIIDRAKVALSDTTETASGIDPLTMSTLKFSGKETVTIPAGQEIYSDPILFDVVAGQDIAVSTYIKDFMNIRTMGLTGGSTYIKVAGSDSGIKLIEANNFNIVYDIELDDDTKWLHTVLDFFAGMLTGKGSLDVPVSGNQIDFIPVITDIEVLNPDSDAFSVVVIGDSTVANNYPSYIAQAINESGRSDVGISAKGLTGNRLMSDGLGFDNAINSQSIINRLKRDTIGLDGKNQGNVKYLILKGGALDIIYPVCDNVTGQVQPSANAIIEGYKSIFGFCRQNGIKVVVIGITPWGGYAGTSYLGMGYAYKERSVEGRRKDWQIAVDVNKWLSNTNLHDGYIDYNEISKNPLDSSALHHKYTSDGLLPTDELQRIWAEKLPLGIIGVDDNPIAAGVGISDTELTLYKGDFKKLTAKVTPENASQSVIWSSSDPFVVTVDSKGNISAKAKGEAVITVKTADKGYSGKGYSASCKITVKIKPESIKISGNETTLYTTRSTKLTVTVYPSDTDFKSVEWSSSKEKVATVDKNGKVTAVGKGTAVITAKSTFDGNIKATYTVKVKKKVQVQAVYLNYDEKTVYVGKSLTLVPSMNPSNATYPGVTWKSSNTKVAKVDKNGKVKALRTGVAVITCKSEDNPGVSATCIINVKIKTTGVKLPTKKLTLYVSQTKTLKAEVLPSNASNKSVSWSSSNKKVATVSKSGKITAKAPGSATITVKTKNGGYKATCKLTVKKYVKLKSFKLNKSSVTIDDGKTYTLKAAFSPAKASNKDLVWKSDNTSVATVSSKGVVKGIKPGKATITCKSKETGKTVKCTVKIKNVKVKRVLFSEEIYTVKHNRKLQLKALISPVNATNQKVKWKSNYPEYVKVSSSGKITALKPGKTVTITATSVDGKKVGYCKVKVEKVPVTGLKLNKTTAAVYTGSTVTLTPKFTPSKPSDRKVTWTVSDPNLATVSSDGVVKALKAGTVTVICTSSDGGFTAKCTVVIEQAIKPTAIKLDKSAVEANIGTAFNLVATIEPHNATNKKVIWSSSNISVATVSTNGKVTTLKEGITYIRAKTEDGRHVASCRINVVP